MSSTSDSSPTGRTITDPTSLAGDPFAYAGDKRRDCFACYEGVVYLGELVVRDDGEELQLFEPVRCRRCGDTTAISFP
jgi:hypothetical protein